MKEYRAYAMNAAGATTDVASGKTFGTIKEVETASRNEFGSGWKIVILTRPFVVAKQFTIK